MTEAIPLDAYVHITPLQVNGWIQAIESRDDLITGYQVVSETDDEAYPISFGKMDGWRLYRAAPHQIQLLEKVPSKEPRHKLQYQQVSSSNTWPVIVDLTRTIYGISQNN